MNRLYWVRHGENQANLTKEFSHRNIDYSLTSKGVLQARQTAEYLADLDIHEIYTSPLKRAIETAEIIAGRAGLEAVVLESMREINVGDLESQPPTAEIWAFHNHVLENWLTGRPETTFPGGENYSTLWGRLQAGLAQIVAGKTGRNIVVVGHGGMLYVTLKDLCQNIDLDWLRCSASHNCSITEMAIDLREGRIDGRLISWASHAHLHGPAANLIPGTPQANTFEET